MLALMEKGSDVCDPYLLRRDDWDEILELKTISARRRCYAYQLGKQRHKQQNKVEYMEKILPVYVLRLTVNLTF